MIRVLVADDHPMVREGLRALIEQLPTWSWSARWPLGWRPSGKQWPNARRRHHGSGHARARRVRGHPADRPGGARYCRPGPDDDRGRPDAQPRDAGRTKGYLLKGATKEQIVRAVTAVSAGEAIFGQAVARHVLSKLGTPDPAVEPFPQLTRRERQSVDRLARGPVEHGDSRRTRDLSEDGQQLDLVRLREDGGRQPYRSCHPCARRRTWSRVGAMGWYALPSTRRAGARHRPGGDS